MFALFNRASSYYGWLRKLCSVATANGCSIAGGGLRSAA